MIADNQEHRLPLTPTRMIGKITSYIVKWLGSASPCFRNKEQRHSKKAYKNKRNNEESIKKAKLVHDLGTNKKT